MPTARWIALAALLLGTRLPGFAASCPTHDTLVICTKLGPIRGEQLGPVVAYKGIPYAKPPVGALRWKPTQPATPWKGVRDGSQYGPICPQIINGKVAGTEDCLTLNVWAPSTPPTRPLPVMVWLTGGGNHGMSGQGDAAGQVLFTGKQLVPEGVVFVSVNIRLGILGFLAHGALDAESRRKTSGNYGSLDQIQMLHWIHDNINRFGGDPKRVMLFGTSAGGGNICALMSSPMTRGLIHAAAMQSSVPTGCELQTRSQAESRTGDMVAQALGCIGDNIARCLRSKSTEELVLAVPGFTRVLPRLYGPVVDGYVFPKQPIEALTRNHAPIPILIGNTTEETDGWVQSQPPQVGDETSYRAALAQLFQPESLERIMSTYPWGKYVDAKGAFRQATTDAEFTCQSARVARQLSAAGYPVYRYLFSRVLGSNPGDPLKPVNHTAEHPFLFAWEGSTKPAPGDLPVQQTMVQLWTQFAVTGNPNGKAAPQWDLSGSQGRSYLEIGDETKMATGPDSAHCGFWDTVVFQSPHL